MIQPRPEVLSAAAAPHGAFDFAELEALALHPDGVIDFSVNSNPYGAAPAVRAALSQVPLDRYPDREGLALRRALAAYCGVSLEQITLGNGTAELLLLVALAFVRPGDVALILAPTFSEYRRVVEIMGGRVQTLAADADFYFASEQVQTSLMQHQPRLVFCCNPNNPTGGVIPVAVIHAWARLFPATLFIIDEAYLNFGENLPSVFDAGHENILVLRSMTKDYALAGLRLGYALGHPAVIGALARVRPAWNVNALAQAAGVAALGAEAHLRESLAALHAAKRELVAALSAAGFAPLPSAVHYFLVDVEGGALFRARLLARGVLVRDCASFGLPSHVRIATRTPAQNAALLQAL